MKVETKFNVGDGIYFLNNNKVLYKEVDQVCTNTTNSGQNTTPTSIRYGIQEFSTLFDEEVLFASKEELLKSL